MVNPARESGELDILRAIRALGEILLSQGESIAVVAVGGTALILQGFVERTTKDVDIIAISRHPGKGEPTAIESPEPLPEVLAQTISRVARDFGLSED